MQALIGNILDRCITDAGYRGHNAPPDHKFKVYTSGQKRRVVSRIFRTFNLAERHPDLGHAVMAPLICWSFSNSMFRYRLVDHAVPAM